jgi:hypothetical protein
MENSRLPPDLERLECLLACGPRPEPSAALRQRVLDDVRAELRQRVLDNLRAELRRENARVRWRVAAACAASLLVGLSLSLAFVQVAGFGLQAPTTTPTIADVARQIQQISPEATRQTSLNQARLRQIADASCGVILNNLFAETKSHHDP